MKEMTQTVRPDYHVSNCASALTDPEQCVHRIHMHAKYEFDTAFHISRFGYWYKMVVTKKETEKERRESKKGPKTGQFKFWVDGTGENQLDILIYTNSLSPPLPLERERERAELRM